MPASKAVSGGYVVGRYGDTNEAELEEAKHRGSDPIQGAGRLPTRPGVGSSGIEGWQPYRISRQTDWDGIARGITSLASFGLGLWKDSEMQSAIKEYTEQHKAIESAYREHGNIAKFNKDIADLNNRFAQKHSYNLEIMEANQRAQGYRLGGMSHTASPMNSMNVLNANIDKTLAEWGLHKTPENIATVQQYRQTSEMSKIIAERIKDNENLVKFDDESANTKQSVARMQVADTLSENFTAAIEAINNNPNLSDEQKENLKFNLTTSYTNSLYTLAGLTSNDPTNPLRLRLENERGAAKDALKNRLEMMRLEEKSRKSEGLTKEEQKALIKSRNTLADFERSFGPDSIKFAPQAVQYQKVYSDPVKRYEFETNRENEAFMKYIKGMEPENKHKYLLTSADAIKAKQKMIEIDITPDNLKQFNTKSSQALSGYARLSSVGSLTDSEYSKQKDRFQIMFKGWEQAFQKDDINLSSQLETLHLLKDPATEKFIYDAIKRGDKETIGMANNAVKAAGIHIQKSFNSLKHTDGTPLINVDFDPNTLSVKCSPNMEKTGIMKASTVRTIEANLNGYFRLMVLTRPDITDIAQGGRKILNALLSSGNNKYYLHGSEIETPNGKFVKKRGYSPYYNGNDAWEPVNKGNK